MGVLSKDTLDTILCTLLHSYYDREYNDSACLDIRLLQAIESVVEEYYELCKYEDVKQKAKMIMDNWEKVRDKSSR